MAKKERPPITVKAYVMVNGVETDVDTLDDERRRQLATAINTTVLNTFFAGKARFYPAEEPCRADRVVRPYKRDVEDAVPYRRDGGGAVPCPAEESGEQSLSQSCG